MPPRTRRPEPAARRDARIRKHLAQARNYWRKAPLELAQGDVVQAGEKGWGAAAQLVKAAATLRGWEHYDHVAVQEAMAAIAGERPEQAEAIYRGKGAAERLHGNFYEVYMTADEARFALADLRILMGIIWEMLPDDYTGGRPFDLWAASGDN